MRRALVALFCAVGCSTGATAAPFSESASPAHPDFASGTRLRAVAWEVDGTQVLDHFFDVQRNEPCAFIENAITHVGPGPTYWCLPLGTASHDADGTLSYFADAACSVPLALPPASGNADYAILRPADACADRLSVMHALPATKRGVFVMNAGGCGKGNTSLTVQAIGDAVPLDQFVSASEVAGDANGRIAPLALVTADGARQTIGGYDRDRKISVTATDPGSKGDPRWFPARLAFDGTGSNFYSDAACGTSVPTKIGRDAVCPIQAGFVFNGSCGDGTYFEVGAPVNGLYDKDANGKCIAATASNLHAFALGSATPAAEFAPASVIERGGNRVHARAWSEAGAFSELVDAVTGTTCAPVAAFDGSTRCLPAASADVSIFGDAACTQPAFEQPTDPCGHTPVPTYLRSNGHAYQVGALIPGPLFAAASQGCINHIRTTNVPAYFASEIPVTRFAKATLKQF
jgi:hypothetical protein